MLRLLSLEKQADLLLLSPFLPSGSAPLRHPRCTLDASGEGVSRVHDQHAAGAGGARPGEACPHQGSSQALGPVPGLSVLLPQSHDRRGGGGAASLRLTCGATVAGERTRRTGEVTGPTSASGSYVMYTTASHTRVGHGAQRKGGTLVGKSLGASRQERQKVTPKSRAPEARPGRGPPPRPLGALGRRSPLPRIQTDGCEADRPGTPSCSSPLGH